MDLDKLLEKFPDAEVVELPVLPGVEFTEGPWKIYIYDVIRDGKAYHHGGKWFRRGEMKYPEEEIPFHYAKIRANEAMEKHLEVRVCNGDDRLVFHSVDGEILHGTTFWNEANPDPNATKVANILLGSPARAGEKRK